MSVGQSWSSDQVASSDKATKMRHVDDAVIAAGVAGAATTARWADYQVAVETGVGVDQAHLEVRRAQAGESYARAVLAGTRADAG